MAKVVFINGGGPKVEKVFLDTAQPGYEAVVLPKETDETTKQAVLKDAEFLVLHPAAIADNLLRGATHLKLLQLLTAGYDKINLPLCKELRLPLATNGGANSLSVADHSVALALAVLRRLKDCDASVRAGTWRKPIPEFTTFELSGKTIGILGAGKIGRKAAARFKAFETNILYYDSFPSEAIEKELGAQRVSLKELLQESDVLSFHLPLFPETRGLIGAPEIALLKPTAVLVNASRAEIIEEAPLVAALQNKKILGAALDVFYEEPLNPDSPLLKLPNVLLTPHMGGHSSEGWTRRCSFAWNNIQRIEAGEAPLSSVKN